jgi:hypothetical protein
MKVLPLFIIKWFALRYCEIVWMDDEFWRTAFDNVLIKDKS